MRGWRDRAPGAAAELDRRARYEGAIVGLAIGDALGTAVATSAFDAARLIARTRESGVLVTAADTAMTRAVAESLLACGAHQPKEQLQRYSDWSRTTSATVPSEMKRALGVWHWSEKAN